MSEFPEYGEREARFSAVRRYGDWHVKVYTIDAGGRTRPAESMPDALARIPALLPDTVPGGEAPAGGDGQVHGEAFAIVHTGADAVWLLVHWWTDACLLHHRVVAAGLDEPGEFRVAVPETLVACSWELAIVHHERDAWVRTVQRRGADADVEAYRADVMGPARV